MISADAAGKNMMRVFGIPSGVLSGAPPSKIWQPPTSHEQW